MPKKTKCEMCGEPDSADPVTGSEDIAECDRCAAAHKKRIADIEAEYEVKS